MKTRHAIAAYATAGAAAILGLLISSLGDTGRILATLLVTGGSAGAVALALWGPAIELRWFRQRTITTYVMLMAFNLFLLATILVEAGALIVFVLEAKLRLSAAEATAVWTLPAGLTALQAMVLLERRTEEVVVRPNRNQLAVAGVLAALGALAWMNAAMAGFTNLFFVTGRELEAQQGVYVLLLGHALMAVAAMVLFRIPALFELLVNRRDELGRLRAVTGASPLLTSVFFAGLALLLALLVAVGRDRVPVLGAIVPGPAWARAMFIVVAVLAVFLVTAATISVRAPRRPLFRKKLEPRQRDLLVLGGISLLLGLAFLWVIVGVYTREAAEIFGLNIPSAWRNEVVVLGIMAVTGPLGFYIHREHRRNEFLEERLADFLADLSESANAGLSLHAALQAARRRDYGPLDDEIALMANQASWGVTFEEVFARFGQRSRSTLVKRTSNLVVESSRSGGNTGDVLKAASRDVFGIKALHAERRIAMTTYLIVIYVVFLVFLAILAVLAIAFLPPLIETTQAASGSGLFGGQRVDGDAMKAAYFHAVLVQAIGNGAVAGVIRENRYSAGLRHIFFMVAMAYLAFKMLIL